MPCDTTSVRPIGSSVVQSVRVANGIGTTELARQDLDAIDDDRRADVKGGAG